jgi:hypothetical protein
MASPLHTGDNANMEIEMEMLALKEELNIKTSILQQMIDK